MVIPSRVRGVSLFAAAVLFGSGLFQLMPAAADTVAEVQTRLLEGVKYLADDERDGRGVGTEGLDEAAEFVRQQFIDAGLQVKGIAEDGFQSFTMVIGTELDSPNTLVLAGPDGEKLALEYDQDFRTCSFGSSGTLDADIVFVGYGIDAEDEKYREFEAVEVQGKVVLLMRRTPQQSNPHSAFAGAHGGFSRHGDLRTKISNAYGQGAAAVLLVNDPYSSRKSKEDDEKLIAKAKEEAEVARKALAEAEGDETKLAEAQQAVQSAEGRLAEVTERAQETDPDPLIEFGYGGNASDRQMPIFHIKQAVADRLLESALGKSLVEIESEIDQDLKPQSAVLAGWKAEGTASIRQVRADVKNVIGVLEGEGPLADETIVIGAHYDHVGLGGEGSLAPGVEAVHNGADDNASGTAALIELARDLAARTTKLPRRLVFIAFTGEERGLIGSARYVKEPIYPLDKTIAMFNMDMVGRLQDDKLTVFGTGTSPRWEELVKTTGAQQDFQLTLKPDGFGPSDQSSFYGEKIPVLHFFTGNHSDYHRPSDDWEKINVPGMLRVIDMLKDVVVATAENPERPTYLEVARTTQGRSGDSRPYFGSIPDFGTEQEGYPITGVSPGSPAERGGLKSGDVIVELGGQKVGGLEDFDSALRKFSAGDEVVVVVLRNGQRVELKVVLDKPR
jgi:hypothetical protein